MSRKRTTAPPADERLLAGGEATPRRRVVRLLAELIVAACRVGTMRKSSAAETRRTKEGAR